MPELHNQEQLVGFGKWMDGDNSKSNVVVFAAEKKIYNINTGCLPAICKSKSAINILFLGVF